RDQQVIHGGLHPSLDRDGGLVALDGKSSLCQSPIAGAVQGGLPCLHEASYHQRFASQLASQHQWIRKNRLGLRPRRLTQLKEVPLRIDRGFVVVRPLRRKRKDSTEKKQHESRDQRRTVKHGELPFGCRRDVPGMRVSWWV